MRKIPLGHSGLFAQIDDRDLPKVSMYKWFAVKPRTAYTYYARANVLIAPYTHKTIYMHRFILDAPAGKSVAHKDGNGLNNQRSNLVVTTKSVIAQNRKVRKKRESKSGFRGVVLAGDGRYEVRIRHNKQLHYLGGFPTAEEAARAYDREALKRFGHHAVLNFPNKRAATAN